MKTNTPEERALLWVLAYGLAYGLILHWGRDNAEPDFVDSSAREHADRVLKTIEAKIAEFERAGRRGQDG